MTRGVFVAGTDTGVGKTVLASAICAALRGRGVAVRASKPVVTGSDEPEPGVPADHELLARCTGQAPAQVAPAVFGPAVSPHLAAEMAGVRLDPDALLADVLRAGEGADALVVEGVGGLLVPLVDGICVRDLARVLGFPVVLAARPGLGTINHTLLALESAARSGLDVRGVVLGPWPAEPSAMERSNRATIERLGEVPVATLPHVALEPAALAAAAAELPLDGWLGPRTPPVLDGEGVLLRPLLPGDAAVLRALRRTPEVERFWFELDEAFPFADDGESRRWTITVDGEVAGLVQYGEDDDPMYRQAWIDVFVGPRFHGRGVGSDAVATVLRHLHEDRGHHRVTIDPAAHNVAAIRAYEKAGFVPVGTTRRSERDADGAGWHDALLMEHLSG